MVSRFCDMTDIMCDSQQSFRVDIYNFVYSIGTFMSIYFLQIPQHEISAIQAYLQLVEEIKGFKTAKKPIFDSRIAGGLELKI